uniref:Uncharacterized protein n=1 Tax=Oryza meridionalis TaxID=40149 RepID=A0A0E0DLF6_9ORYZ
MSRGGGVGGAGAGAGEAAMAPNSKAQRVQFAHVLQNTRLNNAWNVLLDLKHGITSVLKKVSTCYPNEQYENKAVYSLMVFAVDFTVCIQVTSWLMHLLMRITIFLVSLTVLFLQIEQAFAFRSCLTSTDINIELSSFVLASSSIYHNEVTIKRAEEKKYNCYTLSLKKMQIIISNMIKGGMAESIYI